MKLLDKIKNLNSLPLIALGSVLGILCLSACSHDAEPVPVITDISYVSIYHGSPDAEGLDIIVRPTGQINALPFEYEDFSNYLNFYSGDRHLTFTDASNELATVLDTTLNFQTGETYSLFIADSLTSIEVIQVRDSFPAVTNGETMIRLTHLSPDAPEVDIYSNNLKLLENLSFKDVSDFIPVDAGRETFEIRSTETGDVLLTIPSVELFDEQYYNIVVNGFVNPPVGNVNEIGTDIIRL